MPAAKPKTKNYTLKDFEDYIKSHQEDDFTTAYYYANGEVQILLGDATELEDCIWLSYPPVLTFDLTGPDETKYGETCPKIIWKWKTKRPDEDISHGSVKTYSKIKQTLIKCLLDRHGERKILEVINPHLHSVGHLLEAPQIVVHDMTRPYHLRPNFYDDIPVLPKIAPETKAKLVVPPKPTQDDEYVKEFPEAKYDLAAEYEKAKTLDAKLKEYPAVLGIRSQYMWAMINADREGDDKTALKYLAMLEKIYEDEKELSNKVKLKFLKRNV